MQHSQGKRRAPNQHPVQEKNERNCKKLDKATHTVFIAEIAAKYGAPVYLQSEQQDRKIIAVDFPLL